MKLPAVAPGIVFKDLADGGILFSTQQEIYFSLNAVGSAVWRLLPPACETLEEMVAELARQYPDVGPETIERDVRELLLELEREGLVRGREAVGW
jgi:hypothetical protein